MKPFYVGCILLVGLASACRAQLLDQQLLNVEALSNEILPNQVSDQILEAQLQEHERLARDLLTADLLGQQVLGQEVIAAQLENTLRDVGNITDQVRGTVAPVLDPLTQPVTSVLDALPVDAIAKQLPILTRTGETAFVDVQVEDNWRAVEREWLIVLDKTELALLRALRADVIEQTDFADLDMVLVRFRVPAEWDSRAALKQRLPVHLHEQLDRNHIYGAQAAENTPVKELKTNTHAVCSESVKIGMIDTAINNSHSAFAQSKVIARDFLGEKFDAPRAHGTAVAGLLVGSETALQPLLPNATLYAASVFYPRNQYAQGATMMDLVRALNWLASEKVSVINMSLAGPDNQILRRVIARVVQQHIAIVAAAGNEGPAAPPMYPAAYADVIAVTAVDRAQKIYRWANRGEHIDFAAPGVSIITARSDGGVGRETGTSIAAPVVTAFAACELLHQQLIPSTLIDALALKAFDLGEPGRDPIFGLGLLHAN